MNIVTKKINEFVQGERIEGFYLVKSIDLKTANANGKKYLDIVLGDSTGDISAKIWEVKEEHEQIKANTIVKVRGTINNWQSALQFKIEQIRNIDDSDNINLEDYVQTAPFDSQYMLEKIKNYVDEMKNEDIKNIVNHILVINEKKLIYYPAAKKNHHSIRSGLLFHIMTMLNLGKRVCEIYEFLNSDLIYAGVILHDLAKIHEMDSNELGIVNDYTLEGTLLGHITQGIKEVEIVGRKFNVEKNTITLLQHMILSHHYEPEYGSPVKPMIPEAEILHYLDIIDARMYDMKKVMGETPVGEFSERLWSLENRRIYNHGFNKEN
ncbi:3'-5' exoribonuclease YhaM family protein [Clostridium tarantellae]|uniref:HD domain-containing protein n=1 Tax=Clostridium tarantellae TaxID=39493 RepID=A0A6I1MNT1_9CLOT|nr:HD domain-containing protein [Clostridium tarantellae]MPQ42561.1 HD domain-containing protein [Clostridium tarantellae]